MNFSILSVLFIAVIVSFIVWGLCFLYWSKKVDSYRIENENLKLENSVLKERTGMNESVVNEVKAEFSKIAQESLKTQQEQLLSDHSNDLKNKFELFKAQELDPINKFLHDFKESIEEYKKSYQTESLSIKNAVSIAEKYAKALTTNQNSKGEFGEDWLERTLQFANLEENVHYIKQFSSDSSKPDFLLKLPNDKDIVVDSKVILKNYLEYRESDDDEDLKKAFETDLTNCILSLSKKNYEEIEKTNQPGFILMFIPIETCVNTIYTDIYFKKVVDLAYSKNIVIVGTASLLVALRLVNHLWASKLRADNVKNIVDCAQNLYNNIATHAQNLVSIRQAIQKASDSIQTEINRFTQRNNGSIFKEAEKLKDYGIEAKSKKSGKQLAQNSIPEEFLTETETDTDAEG